MEEGNNTPQEQTTPQGHSEFDLVFILILFGLLGIAILLGFMLYNGTSFKNILQERFTQEEQLISNEDMTPENYLDVPGRDKEKLGLMVDDRKGRFYVHPTTGMTLYVNTINIQ